MKQCEKKYKETKGEWGLDSTEVVYYLLRTQQPQVQFLAFPRIFVLMLLRFIDSNA